MECNYSLAGLPYRAKAALVALRDKVEKLEGAYAAANTWRRQVGVPAIAVVGMGRAGKDTAAEFLARMFQLNPVESSSLTVVPFVAHMANAPVDKVYAERHSYREFWKAACHELRRDDVTRLARWCLGTCDFAVGLRGKEELAAVISQGLCALSVWIERNVPVDPTVEFTRKDCDIVIDNDESLDKFYPKLLRLGNCMYAKVVGLNVLKEPS